VNDPRVLEIVQKQLQGVLYIPVLLVLLIPIRQAPQGFWLIFTLVFVVLLATPWPFMSELFWDATNFALISVRRKP
jgi:hypothetical protein